MRKKKFLCVAVVLVLGIAALGVHFVSSAKNSEEHIATISTPQCLVDLTGINPKVSGDGNIGIDTSYADTSGCITAMYKENVKGRLIITKTDGEEYRYALPEDGEYHSYPCSEGSGEYSVKIYTYAGHDDAYVLGLSETVNVNLTDPMAPYLTNNVWCSFNAESLSTNVASQLAEENPNEEDFIHAVYDYVISNITYNKQKTNTLSFGYYPDIDQILTEKKGICVDYAATMASMLRVMGIPTKICFGYIADGEYHAWIEFYDSTTNTWVRCDPTTGANNSKIATKEYVANNNNYQTTYVY